MSFRTVKIKKKNPTTPNADEDEKQQKLSFIADGDEKYTATLEDSLAVSYKAKYGLSI